MNCMAAHTTPTVARPGPVCTNCAIRKSTLYPRVSKTGEGRSFYSGSAKRGEQSHFIPADDEPYTLVWCWVESLSDTNGDCVVNISDLANVLSHFGLRERTTLAPHNGDVKFDNEIDIEDLAMVLSAIGQACA